MNIGPSSVDIETKGNMYKDALQEQFLTFRFIRCCLFGLTA